MWNQNGPVCRPSRFSDSFRRPNAAPGFPSMSQPLENRVTITLFLAVKIRKSSTYIYCSLMAHATEVKPARLLTYSGAAGMRRRFFGRKMERVNRSLEGVMRAVAAIIGIGLATSVALAGGSHCGGDRHWEGRSITTYHEVGDPWYEDVEDTHGSVQVMWQWHRLPSGVTLLRYRNVSYDYVHAEWHFGPWAVEYKACDPHCRIHHVHRYYTECGHRCKHCRRSCSHRGHNCDIKRSVQIYRSPGCEVRNHRPHRSVKVEVHAPLPPIPRIHIHKSKPSCHVSKKTVVRVEKHHSPKVRRQEVRREVKVKRHGHKKSVREIEISGMGKRNVRRSNVEGRRQVSVHVDR